MSLGFNTYAARYMSEVVEAGGSTPGLLVQGAIEELARQMFSMMPAPRNVYPFYGAVEASHVLDLFHSHDLTFPIALTHNANGITTDGATNYALFPYDVAAIVNPVEWSMGVYSRTSSTDDDPDMGHTASTALRCRTVAGNMSIATPGCPASGAVTNSLGLFYLNKRSSALLQGVRNATVACSSTVAGSTVTSGQIIVAGASLALALVPRNYAFAWIGGTISGTVYTPFYNAIQAFQTVLARNV